MDAPDKEKTTHKGKVKFDGMRFSNASQKEVKFQTQVVCD